MNDLTKYNCVTDPLRMVFFNKKSYRKEVSSLGDENVTALFNLQYLLVNHSPERVEFSIKSDLLKDKNILYKIMKYHLKESLFNEIELTHKNAIEFLKIVKLIDIIFDLYLTPIHLDKWNGNLKLASFSRTTSYELRGRIFKLLAPNIESVEVYTRTPNKQRMWSLDYILNEANWVTPRAAMQAKILVNQVDMAKTLSHRLPYIVLFRGNTAVGKSTKVLQILVRLLNASLDSQEELNLLRTCLNFLKGGLNNFFGVLAKLVTSSSDPGEGLYLLKGCLNPDDFKQLIKDLDPVLDSQVHAEGSMLFKKVLKDFIEDRLLTYILDTRLTDLEAFEKNIIAAKKKGKPALLFDFDCELITSLNRVLLRNPWEDPAPPVDEIVKGFIKIREFRPAIIGKVDEENCIKEYQLFCFTKQILVAEKIKGKVIVYNQKIYDHVTKKPSNEDIENTLNRLITPKYVQEAIDRGDIRESSRAQLEQWIENPPLTIRQAVELRRSGIGPQSLPMTKPLPKSIMPRSPANLPMKPSLFERINIAAKALFAIIVFSFRRIYESISHKLILYRS